MSADPVDPRALLVSGCPGLLGPGVPVLRTDPSVRPTTGVICEILTHAQDASERVYRVAGSFSGPFRADQLGVPFARRTGRLRGALWMVEQLARLQGRPLPVESLGPVWVQEWDEIGEWWELGGIGWRQAFVPQAGCGPTAPGSIVVSGLHDANKPHDHLILDGSRLRDALALRLACLAVASLPDEVG